MSEIFFSENYNLGKGYENKGLIFGRVFNSIRIHPKAHAIEKFWADARVFWHQTEVFVAPLSSSDISRLSAAEEKIFFYITCVDIPGLRSSSAKVPSNILFAYQMLADKKIYWTLNDINDAQAAIKEAVFRSNISSGVGNLAAVVFTLPISIFRVKNCVEESTIKSQVLPTMEVLRSFVNKCIHA